MMVADLAGFTVNYHNSRMVARVGGEVGNEIFWKGVIKKRGFHSNGIIRSEYGIIQGAGRGSSTVEQAICNR